jgi:hypothetical protein
LAVLALASTLLAYLLLGVGLTRISSTRASVIATAEPVVATVMAVAVAGERPGPLAYVGGVLVVGSALAAGLGPLDGATVPKQAPYPVPTTHLPTHLKSGARARRDGRFRSPVRSLVPSREPRARPDGRFRSPVRSLVPSREPRARPDGRFRSPVRSLAMTGTEVRVGSLDRS